MPSCKIGSVVSIKNAAGCQWERTPNGMAKIVEPVVENKDPYAMYRKNRKNGTRKNRKNGTRKNRKNRKDRKSRKNRK